MRENFEQAPLISVFLKGDLAKFGECHEIRGYSVHELVQGLCANQPGLRHYLMNSEAGYQAYCGDTLIENPEHLAYPVGASTMTIVAVPMGSGGFGRILAGGLLLGVGLLTSGTSLAIVGLATVVTGAAQLLSPQSKTPDKNERDSSFLFDSLSGSGSDGDPVPLPYGEGPIAGISISRSVGTSDIPI